MTIHVMLDLETWGTDPGCDIRSIGACVFDPGTGLVHDGSLGTIEPFYIACDNPDVSKQYNRGEPIGYLVQHGSPPVYRRYKLTRDPRTVQWWSEQSDEAQAAFADPLDLRAALKRFTAWIGSVVLPLGPDDSEQRRWAVFPYENIRLWSHGPQFDVSILAAAYEACGLPVPWHYRAPRDTRTAFDMAGIDDHSAWLKQHPGPMGVPHHALDDAICQARAVCGAYARVQSPDREFHVGRVAMQQYAAWTNQNMDIGGAWANIERAIHEGTA